jgi:acyl-CoA synthetase (AMP-forming)/AMP-acid ligase II
MSTLLGMFEPDTNASGRLFSFFDERGRLVREASRATFLARANAIARALVAQGLQRGDRAMLVFPPSLEFAEAFVGCLLAGVVPVPAYPPDPLSLKKGIDAFRCIAEDAAATTALTTRR